uniref:ubiquitinyl hydrolase 1 n=1 Tax=Oncorhynchus mykiss TaxID=8022 RepID=A0A8C7NQ27_ONCMY
MSRKQTGKPLRGSNRKCDAERKRDDRVTRRAIAKDRKNRPQDGDEGEEFVSFSNQLQALGLKLREVPGDGNCLFRALGDQLEGHSRGHLRLRQETVQYMMAHRQDFEPFVEDDVPFAQHCKMEIAFGFYVKMLWDAQVFDGMPVILASVSLKIVSLIFLSVVFFLSVSNLSQPGTFAGNDAIVAFARSQQLKVVIHQLNTPLWEINGSEKLVGRELHIAYRYGDHYDSVRPIGDNSESPAQLRLENLHNSSGQREFGDGQRDRRKAPSPTPSEEDNVILSSLKNRGPNCEEENLFQLSAATINAEWLVDSELAVQVCHGQCASGSCSACRQAATECSEHKAPPDGGNIHTSKASNKQRKEQQRLEKKKRQEERHRQKVLQSKGTPDQNQNLSEPVTLVPALNTLSI